MNWKKGLLGGIVVAFLMLVIFGLLFSVARSVTNMALGMVYIFSGLLIGISGISFCMRSFLKWEQSEIWLSLIVPEMMAIVLVLYFSGAAITDTIVWKGWIIPLTAVYSVLWYLGISLPDIRMFIRKKYGK